MSWSALAFPDQSTGSWHQTSEMIQEDMKFMEPQSDPILRMGFDRRRSNFLGLPTGTNRPDVRQDAEC